MLPDTKETELGSSDQEASSSAGKNTGIVLMHCHAWTCVLQQFTVLWIFPRFLGIIFYDRGVLSEDYKNYFKDWCLMNSKPAFMFLPDFKLNELLPFYPKDENQISLNHITL